MLEQLYIVLQITDRSKASVEREHVATEVRNRLNLFVSACSTRFQKPKTIYLCMLCPLYVRRSEIVSLLTRCQTVMNGIIVFAGVEGIFLKRVRSNNNNNNNSGTRHSHLCNCNIAFSIHLDPVPRFYN